jgi:hypothetical protein
LLIRTNILGADESQTTLLSLTGHTQRFYGGVDAIFKENPSG